MSDFADTIDEELAIAQPGLEIPEEKRAELVSFVESELTVIEQVRSDREKMWARWRRQREGRPEQESKDFPWPGASNTVPPVVSSRTNGVYSHLRRAFLKRQPLFSGETSHDAERDKASSVTRFINRMFMDRNRANGKPALRRALYEGCSLGDQIIEVPWTQRRIRFKRELIDGTVEEVDKVTYQGPVMLPHRIENVFVRPEIESLQDQPVIGIRYEDQPLYLLRQLERDGYFINVDSVVGSAKDRTEDNAQEVLDRQGVSPQQTGDMPLFDIWKCWVFYDVDDDGFAEDVILWLERSTGTVLRAELNDFGIRLLTNMRYYEIPGFFYSQGVGSMADHTQEEITSLHNMRINSLAISSLQMFVTRRGSDIGKRETLMPLKNIKVDGDPSRELQVLTFPDVSRSSLEAELQAQRYLDQYIGVSEAMMGMPDQTAKSGTSPSLQMFLAQQGNAILETAVESFMEALSEVGYFFLLQCVAHGEELIPELENIVDKQDVPALQEILSLPLEDVPQKMRISVKTTEIQKSEDAMRQNLMAKNQLYTMYGQEVMQYQQVMLNQQIPPEMREFATQIYVGKTKMMKEVFELMGTPDAEDYVPYVENLEMALSMADQIKEAQSEQLKRAAGRGIGSGGSPGSEADNAGAGRGMERPAEAIPEAEAGGGPVGFEGR